MLWYIHANTYTHTSHITHTGRDTEKLNKKEEEELYFSLSQDCSLGQIPPHTDTAYACW